MTNEKERRERRREAGDVFAAVRERVSPAEAARAYGLRPNRAGFVSCPFHGPERTPSLKLYAEGWHCFGCGAGGSVVDLTARLFSLRPIEAVRKLDVDFSLGLFRAGALSPGERQAARAAREERQALRKLADRYDAWRVELLHQLAACSRLGREALREGPEWTQAQETAVRRLAELDYLSDELDSGEMEREMGVFRRRKEVKALCSGILNATPASSRRP